MVAMKELTLQQQEQINGGGAITIIIYCILGASVYKIIKSSKGRISIPNLIHLEWKQA